MFDLVFGLIVGGPEKVVDLERVGCVRNERESGGTDAKLTFSL
jgi:hypothetical protein